jgi:hypothetical protein
VLCSFTLLPWRWGGSGPQAWMPTYVSILRIPQMIWVWRATVEWCRQGKTEELGEKPVPVPLCPPQIPHRLTRARTQPSAMRGRRLTTLAMTRSYDYFTVSIFGSSEVPQSSGYLFPETCGMQTFENHVDECFIWCSTACWEETCHVYIACDRQTDSGLDVWRLLLIRIRETLMSV